MSSSTMIRLSETFHEQFCPFQQQFNQWKPFEQLYAIVELSRKLQIYHRHYLIQYFQNEILHENNEIFNLTVDEANTPKMVRCRHAMPVEKIFSTLQLHLSLISNTQLTTELFEAYRDILLHLDSKLTQSNSSLSQSFHQIFSSAQQIHFFLQTNPFLQCLINQLPNLMHLIQRKCLASSSPSESSFSHKVYARPLMHHDVDDSGVDLSETSQHSHSIPYSSRNLKISVGETLSTPVHQPLTAVMSAPIGPFSSDYPSYRLARMRPTLTKSDEEEEENPETNANSPTTDKSVRTDESSTEVSSAMIQPTTQQANRLRQYHSLIQRSTRTRIPTDDVSPYLDVDGNRNTFLLPNTGMRDVPRWLKTLRLHKYDMVFSKMTYDEMMDLTMDKLKELQITEGACSKIILNLKKLKERPTVLRQHIHEFEHGEIDLGQLLQHLIELLSTPIRAKPENSTDENDDLPQLILQALDIAFGKLSLTASSEWANQLLGLFDRCYRHEAFTVSQRHAILQWRGRLSTSLQNLGRFEFKNIQAASNPLPQSQRRTAKNHRRNPFPFTSVPLSSYESEPPHPIRRPEKSHPLMASPSEKLSNSNGSRSYLATNQHPTLVKTPSTRTYNESTMNKTRLCKTMSDPHQMRMLTPINQYHRMLTPTHSVQHQLLSAKASVEREEREKSFTSNPQDESTSNHHEFDPFYHQITESAMSDDALSYPSESISTSS